MSWRGEMLALLLGWLLAGCSWLSYCSWLACCSWLLHFCQQLSCSGIEVLLSVIQGVQNGADLIKVLVELQVLCKTRSRISTSLHDSAYNNQTLWKSALYKRQSARTCLHVQYNSNHVAIYKSSFPSFKGTIFFLRRGLARFLASSISLLTSFRVCS